MTQYVATAALVQTHGPDGVDRHYYQHAPIPAEAMTDEHREHLLGLGMIAEAKGSDDGDAKKAKRS